MHVRASVHVHAYIDVVHVVTRALFLLRLLVCDCLPLPHFLSPSLIFSLLSSLSPFLPPPFLPLFLPPPLGGKPVAQLPLTC